MSNSDPTKPVDATVPHPTDVGTEQITSRTDTIKLRTLASFLFGSREAIRTLASHRNTVWLGLTFVLSAGFAREYDGEDLLHEPWHLLLPLAASLGTSFVLFCLVYSVTWRHHGARLTRFWSGYRSFLGLYWMTAPLAWLYAIPVERFLSAADATAFNLWFLAIVSLWRVLLITRVFSILFGVSPGKLIFPVMLFADTLAIVLVSWIDVQILAVMGGVRLTEVESVLAGTKILVLFFGVISWPIWMIGTIVVACLSLPKWCWTPGTGSLAQVVSTPVWLLALGSVALWGFALPWTQPEQQLRGAVERDFRAGRYREMLTTMSAHSREEFPPHWDPPPSIGARGERPRILKIVQALSPDTAPWVRDVFVDKLDAALGRSDVPMETLWLEAEIDEILSVLDGLPEGSSILIGKRELLSQFQRWPQVKSDNTKQKIDEILLSLIDAPPELSGDSLEREWPEAYATQWHDYLSRLEQIEDRKLMLKFYEARLRKVLNEPQFVPDEVLARIRKLLPEPIPANTGNPTGS